MHTKENWLLFSASRCTLLASGCRMSAVDRRRAAVLQSLFNGVFVRLPAPQKLARRLRNLAAVQNLYTAHPRQQWCRQDFVTGGGVRYGSIGGLEYEVPQSRLYCLCIYVALCSTALQCICRVIRRSSMTMKAHTYYIILDVHP